MGQANGPQAASDVETPPEPKPDARGPSPFHWLGHRWIQGLAAFLLYAAAWLTAMGPRILSHLNDRILSAVPQEAGVFVWSFAWWPHALTHLSNPLLSSAVWAPTGLNLAWATTAPGPSLLASPVTVLASPVASFNVVALLIAPLTAWAAYLFTRRVSHSFLAALAGGALFGFSPDVMREVLQGHLNLSLLFLLPLAAYVVVRRMEGSLGRGTFVVLTTAILVGEFLIFTEIFATMAVIGAIVAIVAILLAPRDLRSRVVDTARLVLLSFVLAALVVSPYLFTAFAHPKASKPGEFRGLAIGLRHVRDFRKYVVPGQGFVVGPRTGPGLADMNFWYFGLPLLVVLVLFWIANRRSFGGRLLAAGFLVSLVLSWGRELPFDHKHIPLPWALFAHLPLLGRARAGRMITYAFLFASASVAVWLAQGRGRWAISIVRWALVLAALAFIAPNVRASSWTSNVRAPRFFAAQEYRRHLCPNEIVLVAAGSKQVLWQAQSDMYFRTVGWYPGFRPDDYVDLPAAIRFQRGLIKPSDGPLLRRFLAEHNVTAIILGSNSAPTARQLQSLLRVDAEPTGGIFLMRLAPCPPVGSG